jgi:enterochelin esterase family protein
MIRLGPFSGAALGLWFTVGCGTAAGPPSSPGLTPAPAAARAASNRGVGDPNADGDFVIGPSYADAPELTPRPGIPTGTVTTFAMGSEDSKIYPGLRGPYMRNVTVYVPRQYVPGTPAPFIVAQDGRGWTARLQPILDNMIHDGRLPVMVAIMIDNGGGDGKGSERGLEYDTVSETYANFVESEVLPRVERVAGVKLTGDPEGRATLGGSSGGAAAFTMAWFRPDLYHRVLTYSGTYVNQQSPVDPKSPHGAWEYHEHLVPESDPKPLRIWMEVGENDNGAKSPEGGFHNWVLANQRMAKVLAAKHYHYRYEYAQAARHVDRRVVLETLPAALLWLWQGYGQRR